MYLKERKKSILPKILAENVLMNGRIWEKWTVGHSDVEGYKDRWVGPQALALLVF